MKIHSDDIGGTRGKRTYNGVEVTLFQETEDRLARGEKLWLNILPFTQGPKTVLYNEM